MNVDFRFGIGRFTSEEEVDYTVQRCIKEVIILLRVRVIYFAVSSLTTFEMHFFPRCTKMRRCWAK